MNNRDIETYLNIVKTRNLARTADLMYLSQSTVSRRLKKLENILGYELAKRSKGQHFVQLTERGEQFIPIAERWLSAYNETQYFMSSPTTMHLNIGCTEWFNSFALQPFYLHLLQKDSSLKIKVLSGPSQSIYSLLAESVIDVGFVCNIQAHKGIETTQIFRDPLVLVCNKNSDFMSPEPISPEILDPEYEVEWNHLPDYRKRKITYPD